MDAVDSDLLASTLGGASTASVGSAKENVMVSVRIRPLNQVELETNQVVNWQFNDQSILEQGVIGKKIHTFDRVFPPEATNSEVYASVARPIVESVLDGFNGTVFAYGQTGSGKTHSMLGHSGDWGIIKRAVGDVFALIQERTDCRYAVSVSYFEVYNEEIHDLLQPDESGRNLKLRDDPLKGVVVEGLTTRVVSTPADVDAIISFGEGNRHYGMTNMNVGSSRSHTIFKLTIECRDDAQTKAQMARLQAFDDEEGSDGWQQLVPDAQSDEMVRESILNLVDLAGSERQAMAGTTGKRLKEGGMINKSLSALAMVISMLSENATKASETGGKRLRRNSTSATEFVPYRNSKLTRLLKHSLGGNSLTSILCTMSPATEQKDESVSTLKFGATCKTIKASVKQTKVLDEKSQLRQYKLRILELKQQLSAVTEQQHKTDDAGPDRAAADVQLQQERDRNKRLESTIMRMQQFLISTGSAPKLRVDDAPLVEPTIAASAPAATRRRLRAKSIHVTSGKALEALARQDGEPETAPTPAPQPAAATPSSTEPAVALPTTPGKVVKFGELLARHRQTAADQRVAALQEEESKLRSALDASKRREEELTMQLSVANTQSKARETEVATLRETKQKQAQRIAALEKRCRELESKSNASAASAEWAEQMIASLREQVQTLQQQAEEHSHVRRQLADVLVQKGELESALEQGRQAAIQTAMRLSATHDQQISMAEAQLQAETKKAKALEQQASALQKTALETLARSREISADAELKAAETARLAQLVELERHTLLQQREAIDLAVEELAERDWALDQRVMELDAREEQLDQLAAQYQQQLEHALQQLEQEREEVEGHRQALAEEAEAQAEHFRTVLAAIPIQAAWRAKLGRDQVTRERHLMHQDRQLYSKQMELQLQDATLQERASELELLEGSIRSRELALAAMQDALQHRSSVVAEMEVSCATQARAIKQETLELEQRLEQARERLAQVAQQEAHIAAKDAAASACLIRAKQAEAKAKETTAVLSLASIAAELDHMPDHAVFSTLDLPTEWDAAQMRALKARAALVIESGEIVLEPSSPIGKAPMMQALSTSVAPGGSGGGADEDTPSSPVRGVRPPPAPVAALPEGTDVDALIGDLSQITVDAGEQDAEATALEWRITAASLNASLGAQSSPDSPSSSELGMDLDSMIGDLQHLQALV